MGTPDDQNPDVSCAQCGKVLPRSEMFGLPPDLSCPACARGMRDRMQVRVRTVEALRPPVVTYAVLGTAVALFAVCLLYFRMNVTALEPVLSLLYPGYEIREGEVWRLFTAAFLHWSGPGLLMNVLHLFFNCWWVLVLGRALEHGFGRLAMVLFTVGCAMTATGLEWIMRGGAVGLSGVLFGLATFLYVHRRTNPPAAAVMNRQTLNVLIIWFVLCIYLTAQGALNVANWGHGGGAAWGYLTGLAVLHRKRRLLVPLAGALTIAFVVLSTVVMFR